MLNLVRLRAREAYPDGREATGASLCGLWARERAGVLAARRDDRWRGRFELMLIGPKDERWDLCFIAEYPSVAAFVAMIRDPVSARRSSIGRRRSRTRGSSASRRAPPASGLGESLSSSTP